MSESSDEQWLVGSPAWQRQEEERLAAIANIGTVFEDPEPVEPPTIKPQKPGTFHIWTKEDSLAVVAKRYGVSRQDLLDHNDIDDPASIKPGDNLHLPIAQNVVRDMRPTFEVLDESLPMHVKKREGCKKWSFGNMTTWEDAKGAGFFPPDTNLTIVAIAHVPINETDGKEAEAAYYMDANALGDYATTGSVRWTVGYIWNDLAEGHIDKTNQPAPQVAQRKIATQKAAAIAKKATEKAAATPNYLDGFDQAFIEKRLTEILRDGKDAFKLTRQMLPHPIPCTAHIPDSMGELDDKGRRFIVIHDVDTHRPDRRLYHNQEVEIAQTFEYDGVQMGRPTKACEHGNWYGIDLNLLQSDAELYNAKVPAQTRAEEGRSLTWSERFIWVPASKLLNHPVLERRRQKKQKNKKGQ